MNRIFEEKPKFKLNKRRIILTSIALFIFVLWLTCFKMISPGYVGIVVNLFGEDKGAQPKELTVGMHWIAPWKNVYEFPVFEQNYTWEGNNYMFYFQTGEGLDVSAEIGISYHLKENEIFKLFCKYRRGLDEITDVFIKNHIRDAINSIACKMTVEELYGSEKENFMLDIQSQVKKELSLQGIVIDRVYLIGRLHFPNSVITALNAKIEATQRAQQRENELREAKAQAEKVIAQAQGDAQAKMLRAQAESQANTLIQASLTPKLLAYEAIQRWNGELPQVMSDAINPILDMRQ